MNLDELAVAIVGGLAFVVWIGTTAIISEMRKAAKVAEGQRRGIMEHLGRIASKQDGHLAQLGHLHSAIRGKPENEGFAWLDELAAKVAARDAD